jgi:SNF2 family DNA or RNA helicase
MYDEMKKEYMAFVKEHTGKHPLTVTAQLAITKALRLQQILSGYVPTEQADVVWLEDVPRLKVLSELLEDITPGAKVIVWAVFKENYKMIAKVCDKLGLEYAEIHGDISNARRIEEMNRFRTDEKCRVMIANQSAGGTGINLVEASYAIYYSKGFSLEHDLQSEARNHRGGSEVHDKITRIDLVAKGTIDELVNEALLKKQSISNLILGWKI